jgi:hypothetical protein
MYHALRGSYFQSARIAWAISRPAPSPRPLYRSRAVCFRRMCKNRSGPILVVQSGLVGKSRLIESRCWRAYDGPRVPSSTNEEAGRE